MENLTKEELEILDLKHKREYICFPIINRGQFWYNTLTDTQKMELQKWYDNWLNVTETKVIPTKPTWLEE
ncbi:MAG: hypothetical protein R3Y05_01360 [bacterium]